MLKYVALVALVGQESVNAVNLKSQAKGIYDGTKFEVNLTQQGTENRKCNQGEVAVVNYTGHLKSDGSVFDSTAKKDAPFSFVLGQAEVIECWDEGFKKMDVGSKATFECPASMAYGDVMKPGIPENSDLVFDVELLDCVKDEMNNVDISQMQAMAAEADMSNGQQETVTLAGQ